MLTKPPKTKHKEFIEKIWGISGLRLKDIAYKSNMSISGVARVLYGERVPSDYRCRVMARVLGMKPSQFLNCLRQAVIHRDRINAISGSGREKRKRSGPDQASSSTT